MASALFGALPKEDRNNELKESLMYYLETGRFDILGSTARTQQQDAAVTRLYPKLNEITSTIAAINADNLDFREEKDGQTNREKLTAAINDLQLRKDEIFATGDANTIRQYTNDLGFAYGTLLEADSDTRTGLITGIRRLFGFNPDARRPIGDLMPNIQGFDRNKVRTTDPSAIQYVRYIRPGATERTQGNLVSISQLTEEYGNDAINFFRDVAAANSQYANLVTGQWWYG